MPTPPLSDHIADQLRGDPTSALAALFVIANVHREIFSWVARTICGDGTKPRPRASRAARRSASRSNGAVRKPAASRGSYLARRHEARDRDDESLLEAMKTSPGGPINAWGETVGKSRSSIISALHRLRDQGVVENSDGVWSLAAQQEALAEQPPKWVAPVRGTDRRSSTI